MKYWLKVSDTQSRTKKDIFVLHFMGLSSINYNLKHILFSLLIKYPIFKMGRKIKSWLVKHKVEYKIFVFLIEHTHDK